MKKDAMVVEEMVELVTENGTQSVTLNDLPDVISGRIEELKKLELEVKKADKSAEKALTFVKNNMNCYEEKGKWIFKHKAGNTKDIVDDTQEAVEQLADAQKVSVVALKKSFEFQKKLAQTSQFLFNLGCANLAVNRSAVRIISEKLQNLSDSDISSIAKEEMYAVVRQLKNQEDYMLKQEQLNKEVRNNYNRLNEKDKVDAEQSAKIDELGAILSKKDFNPSSEKSNKDSFARLLGFISLVLNIVLFILVLKK